MWVISVVLIARGLDNCPPRVLGLILVDVRRPMSGDVDDVTHIDIVTSIS